MMLYTEARKIEPDDIIIIHFPYNDYPPIDEALNLLKNLKELYPNNQYIIMPENSSLKTLKPSQLKEVRDKLDKIIEQNIEE